MMNETYCLNEIYSNLSKIANSLHWIHEDFLIPLWIITAAVILAVVVWLVLGVFSAVTLVKLQRKIRLETARITEKQSRELIAKMVKAAAKKKEMEGKIYDLETIFNDI